MADTQTQTSCDKHKEYRRSYYQANRTRILAQISSKVTYCDVCGVTLKRACMTHHVNSLKHKLRQQIHELRGPIQKH